MNARWPAAKRAPLEIRRRARWLLVADQLDDVARRGRLGIREAQLGDLQDGVRVADEARGIGVVLQLPMAEHEPEPVAVEAEARIEVAHDKADMEDGTDGQRSPRSSRDRATNIWR